MKCLGTKGRPDFKHINELYLRERAANSRDYQTAVAMAKAAARMKRGVGAGALTTFGHNSRVLRRLHARQRHLALWGAFKDLQPEDRAKAFVERVMKQGVSLDEAVSLARAFDRSAAAHEMCQREQRQRTLDAWRADAGAKALQRLVADIPGLSAFGLQPEPLGPGVAFQAPLPASSAVTDIVAWAQGNIATNLASALEQEWLQTHRTLRHEECPTLSGAGGAPESKCYVAGVCLCSDAGQRLEQAGARLLRHMRKVFSARNGRRSKLVDGFIVLCVSHEPDGNGENLLGPECEQGEVYYHVGLQYQSPFRPTFMKCAISQQNNGELPMAASSTRKYIKAPRPMRQSIHKPLAWYNTLQGCSASIMANMFDRNFRYTRPCENCVSAGALENQAMGDIFLFYEAMEEIVGKGRLTASFFELEECPRPVGVLQIDTVPVVPLSRCEPFVFFPAPTRGVDRFPRAKRPRAEDMGGAHVGLEVDMCPVADAPGEEPDNEETDNSSDEADFDLEADLEAMVGESIDMLEAPLQEPAEEQQLVVPVVPGPGPEPEPVAHPPPPPAPPLPHPDRDGGRRGRGEAMVVFPHGKISFYASKNVMEATCRVPSHGKCVLTRTVRCRQGTEEHLVPKGGRPLGMLAAWLLKAGAAETKEAHWAFVRAPLAERVAAREYIKQAEHGPELLAMEREQKPTEPEEPETLSGLL